MDRYKAVLLLGAPGAGKGTQGEMLGRIPGFFHMSTGDMFRSLDKQSELGKIFYEYSSKGELVPDEVTVEMWQRYMHAQSVLGLYKPHKDLLLLDGIPRTAPQTRLMAEHIDVLGIIHLVANDPEAMIERLKKRALQQGRYDDAKEDVVRNRIDVYQRETRPVLDCYDASLVHEVEAIGSLAQVQCDVLAKLAPIQDAAFPAD